MERSGAVVTTVFRYREFKHSRQFEGNRASGEKRPLLDRGGDLINHPGRASILSSYGNPVNYMKRSVSYLRPIVIFRAGEHLPFLWDENFLAQSRRFSFCFFFFLFIESKGKIFSTSWLEIMVKERVLFMDITGSQGFWLYSKNFEK